MAHHVNRKQAVVVFLQIVFQPGYLAWSACEHNLAPRHQKTPRLGKAAANAALHIFRASECGYALLGFRIAVYNIPILVKPRAKNYAAFRAGVRVRHPKFGEGLIVSTRGEGASLIANVSFQGLGIKSLSVQIAPLEIIE